MVLFKDDADFQREWAQAKLQAEIGLIDILRNHFILRIINPSTTRIRELARETFYNLRKIAPNPKVGTSINTTLKEAEQERKRIKPDKKENKRQRGSSHQTKKPKVDKKL